MKLSANRSLYSHYASYAIKTMAIKRSKVAKVIQSFASFANGWHYGRGVPSDRSTTSEALRVASVLFYSGSEDVEAFLKTDGSIVVSGHRGAVSVDVVVTGSEKMAFFVEHDGVDEAEALSGDLGNVCDEIRRLGWLQGPWFDSFTPDTTLGQSRGSIALLFKSPQTAFRYSTRIAPSNQAGPAANISRNFMIPRQSAGNRQYSFG
jgi:hypothetical protein